MNSISSSTCSFRFREASPRRKVMDVACTRSLWPSRVVSTGLMPTHPYGRFPGWPCGSCFLDFEGARICSGWQGGEQTQQPRRVSQKIWEIRIAWIFAPRALGDHGQILERCWEDECEWHAKGCLVGWRRQLGTCSS